MKIQNMKKVKEMMIQRLLNGKCFYKRQKIPACLRDRDRNNNSRGCPKPDWFLELYLTTHDAHIL
jgi:hypothetical protein